MFFDDQMDYQQALRLFATIPRPFTVADAADFMYPFASRYTDQAVTVNGTFTPGQLEAIALLLNAHRSDRASAPWNVVPKEG